MNLLREVILEVAERQDAVVTTRQALELGAAGSWVDRQVRSGRWQRLHRGVLVTHSGPVAWRSRARAGLLYAGPGAALSHGTAGYLHEILERPPQVIEVSIPHARQVEPSPGLLVHRRRTMPHTVGRVPRVTRPETAVDLVARARSTDDAVGLLCAAVRAHTWPEQILEVLARRSRTPRRELLLELLGAVADGIESPLEHRYQRDVERRHGLPPARLQVRHRLDGGWVRADRVYEGLGVRVELDGRLAHPGGRTDVDVWRDNAVIIDHDEITLRYRWRHVRVTACRTAAQVAHALTSRGWPGTPTPCTPACPALAAGTRTGRVSVAM